MEQSQTKAHLLDVIQQARADLDDFITTVGEARLTQSNAFGPWTFKDLVAHLTGWRQLTVARMEAAVRGSVPAPPWLAQLDPDEDVDQINQRIYDANRDRSVPDVLRDSRETFHRMEAALAALSETDLFEPNRFAWLGGYPLAAVVEGMAEHFHVEHEPEIRTWLARQPALDSDA